MTSKTRHHVSKRLVVALIAAIALFGVFAAEKVPLSLMSRES